MKSKKALKNILQKCIHLPALEPLLHDAPPNILKHVVAQFAKVLPHDAKARKLFVTSGGLKKIQEIKAEPGSSLNEFIITINNSYPEEIVRLVSSVDNLSASRDGNCRLGFLPHRGVILNTMGFSAIFKICPVVSTTKFYRPKCIS